MSNSNNVKRIYVNKSSVIGADFSMVFYANGVQLPYPAQVRNGWRLVREAGASEIDFLPGWKAVLK